MDTNFQTLRPSLQNSIKKLIEKENFTNYAVKMKKGNTGGNNFIGILYEIDIKGITPENEKEINLFVKDKIFWKDMSLLNSNELFSNEALMYKELPKIFRSLQDQANVPPEERFKMAISYDETSDEAIILENLCKKGYKRYEQSESTSLRFVELGVQELAKLHALSFVTERKMPKYFKEKFTVLQNLFHFNEEWEKLMRKICTYLANLYDTETKTKIENFIPVLLEKFPKYQNDKTIISTLSHGDYKKNNTMIRWNDSIPEEVIIIDYQLMDYGCPIRDLVLFLISESDQKFRRKHLNDLKNLYFETLARFLKYFDMDVESVFPRKEFERIYTEWLDYALMMYLFVSVYIFAPGNSLDVQNLTLNEYPYHPDRDNEKILRELIDDYVEWGYL